MVSAKTLIFYAVAATAAVASPVLLEARAITWSCQNSGRTLRYSQNTAESNSHPAPLSDGKTKSSYPHWFTNGYDDNGNLKKGFQAIRFGVGDCDRKPHHSKNGNGRDDHYLLEFPIFPDGHQYNYDSKPKEDPGPARVIYTYPNKVFCGIVAHTNGNQGNLVLCSK